jgi:aspartate racemase
MEGAIGIIGGVGPYAGVDIIRKIFDNTVAKTDQEHLDLYLTNLPARIGDRTAFLLNGGENPVQGLFESLEKLASIGATVIAIPCNTAHAPAIYDELAKRVQSTIANLKLLNMVEETCNQISRCYPQGGKIGLLATKGTHAVGVYRQYLDQYPSLELVEPDDEGKERVHQAIYDTEYGIKAVSPVSNKAIDVLQKESDRLVERGVDVIILGCTELPLALQEGMVRCPLVDPTLVLARAAISAIAPEKLRNVDSFCS